MRRNGTALLLVFVALLVVVPAASGSGPFETGRSGTTRTVQWTMDGPGSLEFANTSLEPGEAVLAWTSVGFAWTAGAEYEVNGSLDAALDSEGAGLQLRADTRNHVAAGDFRDPAPWTFVDASSGRTTASWDPALEVGRLEHRSAPDQIQWDSLDSDANWNGIASSGSSSSQLTTVTFQQQEGAGMIQAEITTGPSPSAWAGALRTGAFDWSAYERLVVWVSAPDVSPFTVSFNVTALIGSVVQTTTAQPLAEGWQELMVDLTDLGAARASISQVTLRFNGGSLTREQFYLDDVRLLRAKRFNETAEVFQTIQKPNATSTAPGTARFSYNWTVGNVSGIAGIDSTLRVEGPSGTFEHVVSTTVAGPWSTVALDASRWFATPGPYVVRILVTYWVDTFLASNGTLHVDDVDLAFPGRANGSFRSRPIDLGGPAERQRLFWDGDVPAGTLVRLGVRTGNTSSPGDGSWSGWIESTEPGDTPLAGAARYVELEADLNTTNASLGPRLLGAGFEARIRRATGFVTTLPFAAGADFVSWRAFDAGWSGSSNGSISFSVSDDGAWTPIIPVADLRGIALGSAIRFRANLSTTERLGSPRLFWLALEYEVRGGSGAGQVLLDPLLLAAVAAGGVAYVGYAVVARRRFAVEDLFLVARDGRLILHNTNRLRADRDEDLFAGMLTAMSSFVKDTFKEERGGLRQFAVGGKQVLIERLDSVFLAAIYANRIPRWASRDLRALAEDLQAGFGDRLRRWSGSSEDLQDLRALTDRFVRKARYRRWPFPGRAA
ncbi:MAG: hypothetical protein ACT4OI_02445 [Methanobacteriota archaeon]